MKVRFARAADKKYVLKLLDEIGNELNKKRGTKDSKNAQKQGGTLFDEIVGRKDTMIFLAVDKEKIVGVANFYLLPNIRHGWHRGHIEDFVVSGKMRRKGVGSVLMDAIKAYCMKNKIKVIKLDSGLELKEAHKFYEKHGGRHTEKMYRFDL